VARGSFHEDWGDLLERFGHFGPEAAIELEVRKARSEGEPSRGCKFFLLNERLAKRSGR
jgi:hypothetical protein